MKSQKAFKIIQNRAKEPLKRRSTALFNSVHVPSSTSAAGRNWKRFPLLTPHFFGVSSHSEIISHTKNHEKNMRKHAKTKSKTKKNRPKSSVSTPRPSYGALTAAALLAPAPAPRALAVLRSIPLLFQALRLRKPAFFHFFSLFFTFFHRFSCLSRRFETFSALSRPPPGTR